MPSTIDPVDADEVYLAVLEPRPRSTIRRVALVRESLLGLDPEEFRAAWGID